MKHSNNIDVYHVGSPVYCPSNCGPGSCTSTCQPLCCSNPQQPDTAGFPPVIRCPSYCSPGQCRSECPAGCCFPNLVSWGNDQQYDENGDTNEDNDRRRQPEPCQLVQSITCQYKYCTINSILRRHNAFRLAGGIWLYNQNTV